MENCDLCIANTKTWCIGTYYMLQRHILYVAKTKFTCCKDKIYMLQRQNVYAIKTHLYVTKTTFMCYKDKFICYTNKICML